VFVIERKDNNIFHVLSHERRIILPCSFLRFGFLAKDLVAPFPDAQMDFGLRNQSMVACKSHQTMNTIRVKRGWIALGSRSELYPDLLLGATVFVIERKDNNIFHVLSCGRIIILPCSFLRFGFLAKELVAPFPDAQMDFGLRNQSMVAFKSHQTMNTIRVKEDVLR
jgi:hypothetical protein